MLSVRPVDTFEDWRLRNGRRRVDLGDKGTDKGTEKLNEQIKVLKSNPGILLDSYPAKAPQN